MSEKEIGLIAGIIAIAGAVYLLTQKKGIQQSPDIVEKVYSTITLKTGDVIPNVSKLTDDLATKVADAHISFLEKVEGTGLKNIGDLGDAVRVPIEELPDYLNRLKDTFGTVQNKVVPVEVTQSIIDIYSRTSDATKYITEPVKEIIKIPVDVVKGKYTVL